MRRPANPIVTSPRAVAPLVNVYDPPQQRAAAYPASLPSTGVTDDGEVRSVVVPWPSAGGLLTVGEVAVYSTTRKWRAVDVYLDDLNAIAAGDVLTVRVYAISGSGRPSLVASGRVGNFDPGVTAVGGSVWVCAARARAERFEITFQRGSVGVVPPAFADQFSTVTIVASNEADDAPPNLGAIPFSANLWSSAVVALDSHAFMNAELLMVEGVADPAAAAPRFLHVHNRANAAAVPGAAPRFSFPLGLGASVPVACCHWFPGGLRTYGARGWQIAVSSTQFTTTLAAGGVNGLFR